MTTTGRTADFDREDMRATPSTATGSSATPSFNALASAAAASDSIEVSRPEVGLPVPASPSPTSSRMGSPLSNSGDRHPPTPPPPPRRAPRPSPNSSPAPAPGPRQYLAENTKYHGSGVPCAVGKTFPRYHAITAYNTPSPTMIPMSSPNDSGSS